MNWNTENVDPIGDLCKMKVAMESAQPYKIYVNPIDMEQARVSTLLFEQPFVFVDDHVPVGYILINSTLIEIERVMDMLRPVDTAMSICNNLPEPRDLPQPHPRNRAERRAAMKKMKNRREVKYHGN